jgi:branched-chain amino acid transport system ATP-binding protein
VSLLSLLGVGKVFGGLQALKDVGLNVEPQQIFGLIGPNGAGKTTIFNVVTGVYSPDSGTVRFNGESIGGLRPAAVAARGIARTFQNIRLFRSMTVEENVMVAGHSLRRTGFPGAMFRSANHAGDEQRLLKRSHELLDLMNLLPLRAEVASSLPYGSQRRLEIARALMLDPKLILLDEPAAGMNSQEALALNEQIRFLRDELELTVVLVEHNMSVVMNVCDTIHVLDHGHTVAEGTPAVIRQHPKVVAAYLGTEATAGSAS